MKWSKYNTILPNSENEYILYNCGTDKIMAFTDELKSVIEDNIEEPSGIKNIHPGLYDSLCENRFIVPQNYDEIGESISNKKKIMDNPYYFSLTLNPTLACNLKCWYCYETHLPDSRVDEKTMNAIKLLLESKARSEEIKRIGLKFFGGEPLLEFDSTVMPLIEYTNEICKANNKPLYLGFTTNGVLLKREVVDALAATGAQITMQIPFDGDRKRHNRIKKQANGDGTYDLVIKNIEYAVQKKIHCILRCNYTQDNVSSFRSFINDLKGLASKNIELLTFSFHQIWQTTSSREPSLKDIVARLERLGIRHNYKPTIDAIRTLCYADRKSEVVINYNGDVYKCTARDFIPEYRDGVLNEDGTITYNELYEERMESPFLNPTCLKCNVFPICNTCTQKRMEHFTNEGCVSYRNESHRKDLITTRIRLLTQGNHTA